MADDMRKLGAVTYSLGSTIPDNLKRLGVVGATQAARPDLRAQDILYYASPDLVPASRVPVAAIPFTAAEAVPANLRQVINLGDYLDRVRNIFGSSLIGYWPLDEAAGTVAFDRSGNARDGAHSGVTLGQAGIGDGRVCPSYDGTNDLTNIYTAGFAGAFNGAEGTLAIWAKVSAAGVWTDAANRRLVSLRVDDNNRLSILKSAANNTIAWQYRAGGTADDTTYAFVSPPTGWLMMALTWSATADRVLGYTDGTQQTTASGLGVFAGALNISFAAVGAFGTAAADPWSGLLAHAAVGSRALSPTEIAALARVG